MFLSSGNDCILRIWDTNRLKPVETFRFDKPIFQHHLSPVAASSNSLAAVATDSSNVFLVDLISGSTMQQLRSGHSDSVLSVQWSPRDENILVSGGADGRLLVWDVRCGKSLLAYLKAKDLPPVKNKQNVSKHRAHTAGINGIRFTEDGLCLTSYGCDGFFRCWDAIRLRHELSCKEKLSNDGKKFAQFSLSDNYAFVPSGDDIVVIDLISGRVVKTLRGHYGKVNCCSYRSKYQDLFSGANDRSILVWCPKMDQNRDYVEHIAPKALNELVEDAWSDEET